MTETHYNVHEEFGKYRRLKMTELGNMASIIGAQRATVTILCDALAAYASEANAAAVKREIDFAKRTLKECSYVFDNRQQADYAELVERHRAILEN